MSLHLHPLVLFLEWKQQRVALGMGSGMLIGCTLGLGQCGAKRGRCEWGAGETGHPPPPWRAESWESHSRGRRSLVASLTHNLYPFSLDLPHWPVCQKVTGYQPWMAWFWKKRSEREPSPSPRRGKGPPIVIQPLNPVSTGGGDFSPRIRCMGIKYQPDSCRNLHQQTT